MVFPRSFADMKAVGRRYRIAVHESGHSVCGRLLRLPCGEEAIAPRPYANVPVDLDAPSVCAIMGGHAAEWIAFGSFDPADSEVDWELASLGYADGGERLWRGTVNLLRPYGGLISSLALKLEDAGTLDGREIDRIVSRWGARWPGRR
jgi:hypothetical protein